MKKIAPDKPIASTGQVAVALADLSQADMVRLGSFARLRAAGIPEVDWQDLLHEAIQRSLSGNRRWPTDISFMMFMLGTIRSVAHEYRHKGVFSSHRRGEIVVAPLSEEIIDEKAGPEEEVAARESLASIQRLFENDPEAMAVLAGLALGTAPSDIQEKNEMTPVQYASAKRRIRRIVGRAIQKGLL